LSFNHWVATLNPVLLIVQIDETLCFNDFDLHNLTEVVLGHKKVFAFSSTISVAQTFLLIARRLKDFTES
tara:strand:- start:50 stop:259 length:210 start_codon:yes stop_codon:yes gene_type:complete